MGFNKLLLLALALSMGVCAPAQDEVASLEGYIDFTGKFRMYSGYLQLQADPLINVHYLFVTSQDKPETDDVVLWLNGGPGCSSLLGFAQELGPNMLLSGASGFSSELNQYSWNKHANLLFFETPPGVGFSVNKDPDYIYNESRTASDNVKALQKWYEKFPEYLSNKFWISGQSYNGMYIPNFAAALLDANDGQLNFEGKIKFAGILIGNGVMVTDFNWRRFIVNKFYSSHYHYGPETDRLLSNCRYTYDDGKIIACLLGQEQANDDVGFVNPYGTTGTCYTPKGQFKGTRRKLWYTPFHQVNNPKITAAEAKDKNYSPCTDDLDISNYFNKPGVKKALHVEESIEWATCSDPIFENYNEDISSIHHFEKLKRNHLKILLYSGNTDSVVSYLETEEYIRQIGWDQITHKKPFLNERKSLMGWVTQYDGLTYYIVNGAGHMVPEDKPHAAYVMFMDFVYGQEGKKAVLTE